MSEPDVLERLRVYNDSKARWSPRDDSLCVDAAKEITTLRAENERLLDEAYNARQSAKGENALRLEAERERDEAREANEPRGCAMPGCCAAVDVIANLRAEVERWVKEVAHLKLAMEKSERERERDTSVSAKDRFYGYARRSWASDDEAQSEERDDD